MIMPGNERTHFFQSIQSVVDPSMLPVELWQHVLQWVDPLTSLGQVSRQLRGMLGQRWYQQHARQHQWRQLQASLLQIPQHQALEEMLRWGPRCLQVALEDFMGALESQYTRWVLFTYWAVDVWGEARLPRSVQAVLNNFTAEDSKLAVWAHMGPSENVLVWHMFAQLWLEFAGLFRARSLPALRQACARTLTAEQLAFLQCAQRCLFPEDDVQWQWQEPVTHHA